MSGTLRSAGFLHVADLVGGILCPVHGEPGRHHGHPDPRDSGGHQRPHGLPAGLCQSEQILHVQENTADAVAGCQMDPVAWASGDLGLDIDSVQELLLPGPGDALVDYSEPPQDVLLQLEPEQHWGERGWRGGEGQGEICTLMTRNSEFILAG